MTNKWGEDVKSVFVKFVEFVKFVIRKALYEYRCE